VDRRNHHVMRVGLGAAESKNIEARPRKPGCDAFSPTATYALRTRTMTARHDSMGAMKKLLDLISRRRRSKPRKQPLLRSYLAYYNGAMETISGRYFLRTNDIGDR
jgi:hypothetical protein